MSGPHEDLDGLPGAETLSRSSGRGADAKGADREWLLRESPCVIAAARAAASRAGAQLLMVDEALELPQGKRCVVGERLA